MFVKNIKNVDCKNMSKNILLILHNFKILLNKINKAMFDFFYLFSRNFYNNQEKINN